MPFHRVFACYTASCVTTASIFNWYYTGYLFHTCNIAASSNNAISLNVMPRLFVIYDWLSSVVEPKCGTVNNDKPSLLRIFIYFTYASCSRAATLLYSLLLVILLFKSCCFVILTVCLYVFITITCKWTLI